MGKHRVKIGALVGMGPNSTAPFYECLMESARRLYGAVDDEDFPYFVMISLPTPFKVSGSLDHSAMIESLKRGIIDLNRCENVVHQYFDEMKAIASVPMVSLLEVVIASLKESCDRRGGIPAILATESTIQSRVYQNAFTSHALEFFHSRELQLCVNQLLSELKMHGLSDLAKLRWQATLDCVRKADCTSVILACTDLSVCLQGRCVEDLTFFDSGNLLAEHTIKCYMELVKTLGAKDDPSFFKK